MRQLQAIGTYGAIELRRVFPISCSNEILVDIFEEACEANGFVITERNENSATALKEFHNVFQCVIPQLFNPLAQQKRDVIVNLQIVLQPKHDYKLLTIIGPRRSAMQQLVRVLENKLNSLGHYWISRFSESFQDEIRIDSLIASNESGNILYKSDESIYYYFYKIFTNRNYSIGIEIFNFISNFNSNFPSILTNSSSTSSMAPDSSPSNISEHNASASGRISIDFSTAVVPGWEPKESTKMIKNEINNLIHSIDVNFLNLNNPSNTLSQELIPRLRPSLERYVYESLWRGLWCHYRKVYAEKDSKFQEKAANIRINSNIKNYCQITSKFDQIDFNKSINLLNEFQFFFDNSHNLILNLLFQKLLSILIQIKKDVLFSTNSQIELESMDDLAPIFLFILLSAIDFKSPHAIVNLLLDNMSNDQRLESEGRVVTLLEGGMRLVMESDDNLLEIS